MHNIPYDTGITQSTSICVDAAVGSCYTLSMEDDMGYEYRRALAARLYRLANHAAAQGRYRQAAQTRQYAGDVLAGRIG